MFQAAPNGPPLAHSRSDSSRLCSAVEWQSKPVARELGALVGVGAAGACANVRSGVAVEVDDATVDVASLETGDAGAQVGGAPGEGGAAGGEALVAAQLSNTKHRPRLEVQSDAFMGCHTYQVLRPRIEFDEALHSELAVDAAQGTSEDAVPQPSSAPVQSYLPEPPKVEGPAVGLQSIPTESPFIGESIDDAVGATAAQSSA